MEHNPRKIIGISIGIIFFLFIVIFGFNRFERFINGPSITSISLEEYTQTNDAILVITGTVENTSVLSINGKNIPINDTLDFEHIVVIPVGHSIIEVDIFDTFGKEKKYRYQIMNTAIADSYPSTYIQAQESLNQSLTEEEVINNE